MSLIVSSSNVVQTSHTTESALGKSFWLVLPVRVHGQQCLWLMAAALLGEQTPARQPLVCSPVRCTSHSEPYSGKGDLLHAAG